MNKSRILLAILFCFSISLQKGFAQQNIIKCFSEENFREQAAKDPSLIKKRQQLETQMAENSAKPMNIHTGPYVIPTVVHIIHEGGDENISKAQVLDQLRIMNEDLRKMNPDTVNIPAPWKTVAADCNMEFRLAQKDPSGNCTDGINRVYSHLTNNARDNVKSVIQWDNTKYFNIWIVKSIDGGGSGGGIVLGFSSFPGLDPAKDGIVIRSDCFGSIGTVVAANYDKWGRTTTHEVGHFMNLFHIWGDDNGLCSGTDYVTDTPNEGDQHFGCGTFPIYDNCSPSYPGIMFMNYMDYSDGNCVNMFTQGQKTRITTTLNGTRSKLWSAANLVATGTDGSAAVDCIPKAEFMSSGEMICEGDSVTFTDKSWHGLPTSWSWSFPGGTPSSSTSASQVVKYNTAGSYSVSLTVSNNAGTNTITKVAKIYVSATNAIVQDTLSYYETYDVTRVPGPDWAVKNDATGPTWKKTFISNSDSAMRISAYAANVLYEVDEMISPSVNLTKMPSPMLKFSLAYVRKTVSTNSDDILKVLVSSDCGKTWTQRYSKSGTLLATAAVKGGFFAPTSSEWRTETVSLATVQNKPSVRIKFQFAGGAESNNIYINDFKIYSNTVGIENISSEDIEYEVYPNPSKGNTRVHFNMPFSGSSSVIIHDVLGRELWNSNEQKRSIGSYQIPIDLELKSGMYFVSLRINEKRFVKKLLVE